MLGLALILVASGVPATRAQEAAEGQAPAEPAAAKDVKAEFPDPAPMPVLDLASSLHTTPVKRGVRGYNVQMVDASLLPRDKAGIWVLDFAFKPVRILTVDLPGKGRRYLHYMYYRVVNRTGKPRMFVPQFTLVTDTGQRKEDTVIPQAVELIKSREDYSIPLLGAVNIMGMIPPSKKDLMDDAVYGVAVWEGVDPAADRFSVYVRGLSDGYQVVKPPGDAKPVTRYKTLRIDFIRRGDEHNLNEKEIQLLEPSHEWIYW
jgi:hypothetical protein